MRVLTSGICIGRRSDLSVRAGSSFGAPETLRSGHFKRSGGPLPVLVLGAVVTLAPTLAGHAQPVSGPGAGASMEYMTDVGCAAAAEAWLIGMPNGTPDKEQAETATVALFFTRRAEVFAEAAGRRPSDAVLAVKAFEFDLLPKLKSPDPATADQARAEAAKGSRICAARPEFENRAADGIP